MAAPKKEDVVAALEEANIEHDPSDKVADLRALLPADHPLAPATDDGADGVKDAAGVVVTPDRQARWDAFLEKAKKENALFAEQEKNGEFKVIPASFA